MRQTKDIEKELDQLLGSSVGVERQLSRIQIELLLDIRKFLIVEHQKKNDSKV